jgi:O-antigen/teichoic acid export membrane protein
MIESTSKKIVRNSAYSFVGFLILAALQFFSTPYIVHTLGKEAYGVYALISVFIGYVSLLELGIGASIIKYVSEYYVDKRYDRINKLVSTAFVLFFGLGLAGTLIVLMFREYFATTLFKVPTNLIGDTVYVFTVAGIAFFFTFVFGIFISVLVGLQRMDLTNEISIVFGILNIAGIVSLLWLGYGLKEVVILSSLNGIIGVLISMYISKRITPTLSLTPKFFDKSYVKSIFHFSLYVFASKIAVLVYQNFGKLIVGIFLPIRYVTIYAVGAMLSSFIYRISGLVVAPVLPASSELLAKKDTGSLKELFLRGTKYVTIINIPSIVFLGIFADEIIRLWMGEGFEESVLVFRILLIGLFIETMQHIGGNMLPGIGKPKIGSYYATGTTLMTIILSIILLNKFGLIGAAIGSTIAQLIIVSIFIPHLCRIFEIRRVDFLTKAIIKPIIVSIPLIILALVVKIMLPPAGWMELLVYGVVFTSFYIFIIMLFVLDGNDIMKIERIFPQAKILQKFIKL